MSNSADIETPQATIDKPSADKPIADQPSAADLLVKAQQADQSKLSPEDLARVQKYLSSPIHSVERKPFKPWMMMLALVSVVVILGLLSQMIAWFVL